MCSSPPPTWACPACRYSVSRLPPFQNSSSNASVSRVMRRNWNILRKICDQDHSDSAASSAMIACTMTDAWTMSVRNERSVWTFTWRRSCRWARAAGAGASSSGLQCEVQRRGNPRGPPPQGIEAGERDMRRHERRLPAKHALRNDEPARAPVERFDRHVEAIVQSRGQQEVDFRAVHGEGDAVLPLEFGEPEAERFEPLGARTLHEPEVVRVIDDAC